MAKLKQKLKFRLPEYVSPRNAWRKKIHAAALKAAKKHGVEFGLEAGLTVEVKPHLCRRALETQKFTSRCSPAVCNVLHRSIIDDHRYE